MATTNKDTTARNILVVEDDLAMRQTCMEILERSGYSVEAVADGETAVDRVRGGKEYRVALVDLKLPKMDGVTVLEKIRESHPNIRVIIMTGYASVQSAVKAMKLGAVDYLVKPFELDELLAVVAQHMHIGDLEQKITRLESELSSKYSYANLIGRSHQMEKVFERITAAKGNKANVLIVGASGTGKELVAKAIHYSGGPDVGPFVPVNCAALPEALVESELFGHTKGAFTGADRDFKGLFRAANGGTIFLDEVFEVPPEIQVKLLRTIQESTVRPVGGLEEIPINVRVIAATNQDPSIAMEKGRLRKDLFYRLAVITILLPELRERPGDVAVLIEHFMGKFSKSYGSMIPSLGRGVMQVLNSYAWPGNVRELENLIEQWFAMGLPKLITLEELPGHMKQQTIAASLNPTLGSASTIRSLHDLEREVAVETLKAVGQNKSKAASLLGISRKKLYKLLGDAEAMED